MSITIASLPSGDDLRSTGGPSLDKVRHHIASEAMKRGSHMLGRERSEVWQDQQVIYSHSFKFPDAATHLLSVTKQDESCCFQFVIAALLRVESAAHVPVKCSLSLCSDTAWTF